MSRRAAAPLTERRFLLYGMGVTNTAVARALVARGLVALLVDDGDPSRLQAVAADLGADLDADTERPRTVHAPDAARLAQLLDDVDAVIPAPGLPERHAVFAAAAAAGRPILSEFDLAGAWDDRPVLAVTGTNGKTTVATLVQSMLQQSGLESAAVGNLETPLVEAIDDPAIDRFVVEASSFRLAHSRWFRPAVATWLNFAEDHLDVHESLEVYRAAKARIFADQGPGDVAVLNAEDPVVAASLPAASLPGAEGPAVRRFGLAAETDGRANDYHEDDGVLVGPDGEQIAVVADLWSTLPHDRSNVLAAAATALAGGATLDGVRAALADFGGLAHRVQLIGEHDGVRWYDDSKATAPHATLAAVAGFTSVVLIAGGRNKGLDLATLADAGDVVTAVVGIGDAGEDVVAAFPDRRSQVAASMAEAVEAARSMAAPGDVVLLSPGCASFDWYSSYAERGDDFTRLVRAEVLGVPPAGER